MHNHRCLLAHCAVALAVLGLQAWVVGCSKTSNAPSPKSPEPPVVAAAGEENDASCDAAGVAKIVDKRFTSMDLYYGLAYTTLKGLDPSDCDAATQKIGALEQNAKELVELTRLVKAEAAALPEPCRSRLEAFRDPRLKEIRSRYVYIQDVAWGMWGQCYKYEGFRDAIERGLMMDLREREFSEHK